MQTTQNGRTYEVTKSETAPALSADLIRRGWDGSVYYGVSKPFGRQRHEFNGIFYRSAATGEFCSAL